jgi:hypothetical protein
MLKSTIIDRLLKEGTISHIEAVVLLDSQMEIPSYKTPYPAPHVITCESEKN